MNAGLTDKRWDEYDVLIKTQVTDYAKRFKALENKMDWKIIKAMVWTESGGVTSPQWKTRAMQIGNSGDPAFAVLKDLQEGSDLVMSVELKLALKSESVEKPELNIKAGIAYLYTKMVKTLFQSVLDAKDSKTYEYTVIAGDSLDKIAKKVGSTIEELRASNPGSTGIIRPGQKFKYRKAAIIRVITGWREFTIDTIADAYNGGGDASYAEKLTYITTVLFPKLVR
ncbi:MAG: hypothetical protein RL497_2813 [Pseudomonadota bacterium]